MTDDGEQYHSRFYALLLAFTGFQQLGTRS
jgi:hypothetical protein